MTITDKEMHDRFHYHSPSEEGVKRHAALSKAFADLGRLIYSVVPNGREQSLALTNLEQSKFWASAGVARNPDTR